MKKRSTTTTKHNAHTEQTILAVKHTPGVVEEAATAQTRLRCNLRGRR